MLIGKKSYLVNGWGICLIKSVRFSNSILTSFTNIYLRWCLSICLYVYSERERKKTTSDNWIIPLTDSRIEFQGESEVFFCLNNRSIYREREKERKKIVRWQRPYLYTRECLLSLLLLHLIESIVFPSLSLSPSFALLSRSTRSLKSVFVQCVTMVRPTDRVDEQQS